MMAPEDQDADFREALHEAAKAFARTIDVATIGIEREPVEQVLAHPLSNVTRAEWAESIALWRRKGVKLLKKVERRVCPSCGGDDFDPIFESYDGYPYVDCRSCRSWYVPLKVNDELFRRYFEMTPEAKEYGDYTDTQMADEGVAENDLVRFRQYFDDILLCLGPSKDEPRKLLDFGCGVGNSIEAARKMGLTAIGVETNEHAVKLARAAGRDVYFPHESLPEGGCDIATFWESLEHMDDPLAALLRAKQRLSPQGMLAITVPNLNSPSLRSLRADSTHINGGPAYPGHINLFTPSSLRLLLARAGFEVIDTVGQYSMNLYEIVAYHLGVYSGARSALRQSAARVRIPPAARDFVEALAPAISVWEEAFSFAPILRVLAVHEGAPRPPGLDALVEARREKQRRALSSAYGLDAPAEPEPLPDPDLGRRGAALSLDLAAYRDPSAQTAPGGRLRFSAQPAQRYGYLWKSLPVGLGAETRARLRGRLYRGAITFGLQADEKWIATASVTGPGPFELTVRAGKAGLHEIVIADGAEIDEPTDVDFDSIELLPAEAPPPQSGA